MSDNIALQKKLKAYIVYMEPSGISDIFSIFCLCSIVTDMHCMQIERGVRSILMECVYG